MTRLARALSMAIGFLLLLHFGVMAMDPVGMHAGAETSGTSVTTHASHTAHAAHDQAAAAVVGAGACIEAEGIASQMRVPLDPVAVVAVLPAPLNEAIADGPLLPSGWVPPVLDGRDPRVLLQVFLN